MKFKFPSKKHLMTTAVYTAAVTILVCSVLNTVFAISIASKIKQQKPKTVEVPVFVQAEIPKGSAVYKLLECGGKIGIYDASTNTLIDIIDVFASSLPQGDRDALKDGIDIYSFTELAEIITDFTT